MNFAAHLSRPELTAAVSALDQALYVHEQWSNNLSCTLICRLMPDERDLMDHPHRRCAFGQWYYGEQHSILGSHPGFVAIEPEHERLHRLAAAMLQISQLGEPIPIRDYENYLNAMTHMRAEIQGLRFELDDSLRNLDPLTGASSRIGMLSKLRRQQEVLKRELQTCAIAMMDLDHFKDVNDSYGHSAGDAVLAAVARQVLSNLRPYDEFFRYGGEEFLLWTPGTDLDEHCEAIGRLREGLANTDIDVGGGRVVQITASFGVTLPDPDVPVEESIERADQALYAAKVAGRNRLRAWDPSMAGHP